MNHLNSSGFQPTSLDDSHQLFVGKLPLELILTDEEFVDLWEARPDQFATMPSFGRIVEKPRWDQAYGRDYRFSGVTSKAVPMTPTVDRYLEWCQAAVDARMNGALVNWYDASLGHYIGLHHDQPKALVPGAPIVTISFGEARVFRMQKPKSREKHDFVLDHGSVLVIPFETNLAWKHALPRFARYKGKRVSLTFRAFQVDTHMDC